ncbi:MAG: hypothetical protein L6408_05870, partial [Nanoarchaeota archaeon]|nr:hypothetical protein [Nanoarchaeota archaeon]
MFIKKKRVVCIILSFLLCILLFSTIVSSEIAYFAWYDASGAWCQTSTKDAVLEGYATTTDYDAAPLSNAACCDVEGLTYVYYFTDAGWSTVAGAYDINWDLDSVDCVCNGKTWMAGKSFDSGKISCCGDDSGEVVRSKECAGTPAICSDDPGDTACCGAATDCVVGVCYDHTTCYLNDGYCDSGTWYDSDYSQTACDACVALSHWQIGGETAQADTHCCGDDEATEIYEVCEVEAGYDISWTCTEDACCNADKCVDKDSNCYASDSPYSDINTGGNDDSSFCNSNYKWQDCDESLVECGAGICGNVAGVYAGEQNFGEYSDVRTTLECCGDDASEYYVIDGIGNQTSIDICCNSADDCMDRQDDCRDEYVGGETICNDNIDNDCDGKTDCSDTDCEAKDVDDVCFGCEPEICNNDIDDDCDRYIDCADNDCLPDVEPDGPCSHCSVEICNNIIDDDCDGKIDCADNECLGDQYCISLGCIWEICDDGIDNDCDGIVDYGDWDCPDCNMSQTLCVDGQCRNRCEEYGGTMGCITQNDICEEGEGCGCEDCYDERDSCNSYLECDSFYNICLCPSGTKVCPDGSCRMECNVCGNDIIESGEECDGASLPGGLDDCSEIDACIANPLTCLDDCFIDSTFCEGCEDPEGICGNNLIGAGETCDGINFDGKDCTTFGFTEGSLACFAPFTAHECHFDTSGCFNESESCIDDDECNTLLEDCTCADCLGQQGFGCKYGNVCDETGSCKCEDGTTLCLDDSCRIISECADFPVCNGDGTCDLNESCACEDNVEGCIDGICPDCEDQQGPCRSSSACMDGVCTSCALLKVYWSHSCIGSGKEVQMIVEGTPGCADKTLEIELWEEDPGDDDNIKTLNGLFNSDGKVALDWNATWYTPGTDPNECPWPCSKFTSDAWETDHNSYLEYYFIAKMGGEEFQSTVLDVNFCIPECDDDCDKYIDSDLVSESDCTNALALGNPIYSSWYGLHKGELKIDANPKSEYCQKCDPLGLSPGQETCAAHYDCTPGWWGDSPPAWKDAGGGDISGDQAEYLMEWSECDEGSGTRSREVCPGSSGADCCLIDKGQSNCFCEIPTTEEIDGYNCNDEAFIPSKEKYCLAEEKFPFFTTMNMVIVTLILIGFYLIMYDK